MEIVYQSKYLTLIIEADKQLCKVLWSNTTENMLDSEFRAELIKYVEVAEKYQPLKSFVDTKYFLMPVVPETQEWINANIHQRSLNAGIKKFAYLVSKDLFSQVSIEQSMDEGNAKYFFDTRYFDEESEAMLWLSK
jgi:hypothetical protein